MRSVLLLLLLACAGASAQEGHGLARRLGGGQSVQPLSITAVTPDLNNQQYTTFVGLLPTVSYGQDAPIPGLFWGAVPADSVRAACRTIASTGAPSIPAIISGYNRQFSISMRLSDFQGCPQDTSPPIGVQARFTDGYGQLYALVCDNNNTLSLGCGTYLTGNYVNWLYANQYSRYGCDGRADCNLWGPSLCTYPWVAYNCPCMCYGPQFSSSAYASGGSSSSSSGGDDSGSDAAGPGIGDVVGCAAGTLAAFGQAAGGKGCKGLGKLFGPLCVVADGFSLVTGVLNSCGNVIPIVGGGGNRKLCFPGNALVSLRDGTQLPMHRLQLGQEVAVQRADGGLAYEPVYAWGHQDPHQAAQFVQLDLVPATWPSAVDHPTPERAHVQLSPGHFALVAATAPATAARGQQQYTLKRADRIAVHDVMWVMGNTTSLGGSGSSHTQRALGFNAWRVAGVQHGVRATGLYSPYTPSGTIVVNNVATSCHSEWHMDTALHSLGLQPQWLPHLHQAALAPARGLLYAVGKERYVQLYDLMNGLRTGTSKGAAMHGAQSAAAAARPMPAGMSHKAAGRSEL